MTTCDPAIIIDWSAPAHKTKHLRKIYASVKNKTPWFNWNSIFHWPMEYRFLKNLCVSFLMRCSHFLPKNLYYVHRPRLTRNIPPSRLKTFNLNPFAYSILENLLSNKNDSWKPPDGTSIHPTFFSFYLECCDLESSWLWIRDWN